MVGYLYILESLKNRTYYIGSTIDFNIRLIQHKEGKVKATRHLLPVKPVYVQKYDAIKKARTIEYWLKKQKDKKLLKRIIKEGIIRKQI